MVLESVVAGLLNRFLSAYVSNLNSNSLNVGIWSGDVKLRNLRLKREALDKFRLPVDVLEGYLGELTMSIPWTNLKGKPVKVLIENVYLLAVPQDSSKTTPAEDEQRAQDAKQEKLGNAEMLSSQTKAGMTEEEAQKNESFTSSLVTKIVDNLQIEVRNIHIRYEDNLSVPGHPFSAGITLSGFSAVSTDEFWQPTFIQNSRGGIHKLAKLESLAVYFDTDSESLAGYPIEEAIVKFTELISKKDRTPSHQFILKPVSGEGRLVMNHHPSSTLPKTDAELLFHELGFALDADQYRDILSMVDLFHFYIRQREYRRFRPTEEELSSNRPRALLRFAGDAILRQVHEKNRKWSWGYFAERRDDRREYVRLFKLKLALKGEAPVLHGEEGEKLRGLERKLEYKDIRFYRSLARSEMRKEATLQKREEAAHPQPQQQQGWIGWMWGGVAGGHHAAGGKGGADDGVAPGLSEEQRKELYQAIEWDEREAVAASVDLPKETMTLRVKAKLETGSFALRTSSSSSDSNKSKRLDDLVSLNFDGFRLDLVQRPENFDATLALDGFRVFDGTNKESVYPQIVRVKKAKKDMLAGLKKEKEMVEADEHDGVFSEDEAEEDEDEEDEDSEEDSESDGSAGTVVKASSTKARRKSTGGGKKKDPFFWLKFEHKPLDGRADSALNVRLRHMEIIYHRSYVEAIFKFFKPPESQLESVGALIDVASETLEGIRKETRAGLEYALTQHKTVDVRLDLNAPIIIIPEDISREDCLHVVLDAGHIAVESDLVDQEALSEVRAKEKQEYHEEDYKRLEELMYDKFYIKLESAQLLMGPDLQTCLDALEHDHEKDEALGGPGELHILERTSLTFLAQNCILAKAPNLTRFKVSGSLPALQLNFSDRKYKSMMKMLDVAIPKFGDEPQKGAQKPPAHPTPLPLKKALRQRSDSEVEYHLDVLESEDEDAGGKDEFYDTQDISDGNAVVHQKTFEFFFKVDKVQASIYRSNSDPRKPDFLLANTVLEGFQFEFTLRPFDMFVDILLRTLYVEDKMIEHRTDFRHLVTSGEGGEGSTEDLVRIRYHGVNKESPEFMTVYEGLDKTVDVEFSTISIIITRASILTLFDWVMATFTDQSGGPPPSPDTPINEQAPDAPSADKLRVKVKLTKVNAILNDDGMRLATLSLSAADVTVMLRSPTLRVALRLGNLTLVDDYLSTGSQELLSITGDHLADFSYETFDPTDLTTFPGYESSVYLRSGSLKFTFVEEPVNRLLIFFSKFAKMKAVYDAATRAAAQQAIQVQTTVQRMHYDILVRTPILIFPRNAESSDRITANLGEISLSNRFETKGEHIVTHLKAGLRSVRLTSRLEDDRGKKNELHMLDDLNIDVDMRLTQATDPTRENIIVPATQITAKMSDVKMNLTQAQYGFLIQLSSTVPAALSTAGADEVDDASLPSLPKQDQKTLDNINGKSDTTIDLLPELSSVAKDGEGKTVALRTTLELTFNVNTVYLEIYTAEAVTQESLKSASLARFSLNETGLKYKMLDGGSMEAELVIRSFTIHDTRPARQTKFREIIPATTHDSHQFMVNFTKSGGADASSFVNVAIDSPKIIFSLDPLFALLEYFTSAFKGAPKVEEELDDEDALSVNGAGPEKDAPASTSTFAYRVNVTSPTVILLDNPDRIDSEAVVLSISQVQMAQQGTLALTVDKIGMFLCRMDKPKESIRVLDNFAITLSMDSRAEMGHQVTSIEIGVQPLVLRVSLRDIFLIKSIVNRAIEMSGKGAAEETDEVEDKKQVVGRPRAPSKSIPRTPQGQRRPSGTRPRAPSSVHSGNRRVEAKVVMSKESLKATFEGLQLVLIGDLHDLPLLDIKAGKFAAKVKDWSSDLKASVGIVPFINYFNLSISHWEPLMDPWEFSINVARTQNPEHLGVVVSSRKRLELNVTSTLIEVAMTTAAIIGKEGDQVFRRDRGSNAPFVIRNRTGYTLSLWSETTERGRATSHKLEDGRDVPWRFDDWRTMRENIRATSHNSLTVHFEGMSWDRLRHISVDREGEQIYPLRPKLDKVSHRVLCEVKLVKNVKVVTFRSTFQIENRSMVPIEMMIVDGEGKKVSQVYNIPPGEDCPVPILPGYNDRIKLRPDAGFGYGWSNDSYSWQDLVKRPRRAVVCKAPKEAAFRFQAFAIHDKSDPLLRVYPKLSLRLRAPVEIQNLLPFDIRYRVFDKNIEHNWTSFLRQGGVSPVHIADLSHLLLLSVHAEDTLFERSEFAIINSDNPEDLPAESDLMVQDKNGLKLKLGIHYQKHPDSGGAFRVQVYTPYSLINKTGYEFAMRTKTFLSGPKDVAGQEISSAAQKSAGEHPFMFSFPSDDTRNRVLLKVNDSNWSKPLSFETVGMETAVVLPSTSGTEELHIGLKVAEGLGDYKLTKVITMYPRFVIKNSLPSDIRIRQYGATDDFLVPRGERQAMGYMRAGREPMLTVALPDANAAWSAPFKIQDIGQAFLRLRKGADSQETLIQTEVILEGPCIFVRLETPRGSWPFMLQNDSDFPVQFWQTPAIEANKDAQPVKKYNLRAHAKAPYAWDYPADSNKALTISSAGRERSINPLEIGSQIPFRFHVNNAVRTMSIDVKADGPVQAVILSNYAEEESVFKLQRRPADSLARQDSVSSSKDGTFEAVDIEVVTSFTFSVNFEGIGISVVNRKMQELVYASFRGVTFRYADSTTNVAYDLGVKWIQIDNQLFGGLYPILFYPSVIPKDGKELEVHPSLQASAIVLKDDSHGVTYFKYASVLLQEMTVEVDEDFLFALLDFAKFPGAQGGDEPLSALTDEPEGIPEPTGNSSAGDLYFEVLHMHPTQLDLSFMRTDRVNVDQKLNTRNPFFFFINALTMTLGNVNDAPVRLNALVIENARLSMPVLQDRLTIHYRQEFLGQLYRILGSADFLGNPVGLFTNVSSGVADFFIQPYDSIMMNGNKDLGVGIARGAGSLAKKTVFGLSDSVAKVTGSIGKGLSAATLDKEYQSQRRMRQYRNKPKHALYGVSAGASSFVSSVASGFEGLATKPLEGAEMGGAAGFFKGVGKGVVGVVTKPVVGFFDLANNITEGIRNTTQVFEQTSIDRVRLPRFTANDGILRPYQEREALGQNWLKATDSGKYFDDVYVAHLDIPSTDENVVVILATKRILLVKVLKLKTVWDIPFTDLQQISLEPNGITLVLRGGVAGPFLEIKDQSARLWLFRSLERAINAWNSSRQTAS